MAIYAAFHPRTPNTRSFTFDNRSGIHFHTFAWRDIPTGNQSRYYYGRQATRSGEQGAIRRLLREIPRVCETHARVFATAYHGHSTIATEASFCSGQSMRAPLAVESGPVTVTTISIHCTGNAFPCPAWREAPNTASNCVIPLMCCCRQQLPAPPQRPMQSRLDRAAEGSNDKRRCLVLSISFQPIVLRIQPEAMRMIEVNIVHHAAASAIRQGWQREELIIDRRQDLR